MPLDTLSVAVCFLCFCSELKYADTASLYTGSDASVASLCALVYARARAWEEVVRARGLRAEACARVAHFFAPGMIGAPAMRPPIPTECPPRLCTMSSGFKLGSVGIPLSPPLVAVSSVSAFRYAFDASLHWQ